MASLLELISLNLFPYKQTLPQNWREIIRISSDDNWQVIFYKNKSIQEIVIICYAPVFFLTQVELEKYVLKIFNDLKNEICLKLIALGNNCHITFSGHYLGGSLSLLLNAYFDQLCELRKNPAEIFENILPLSFLQDVLEQAHVKKNDRGLNNVVCYSAMDIMPDCVLGSASLLLFKLKQNHYLENINFPLVPSLLDLIFLCLEIQKRSLEIFEDYCSLKMQHDIEKLEVYKHCDLCVETQKKDPGSINSFLTAPGFLKALNYAHSSWNNSPWVKATHLFYEFEQIFDDKIANEYSRAQKFKGGHLFFDKRAALQLAHQKIEELEAQEEDLNALEIEEYSELIRHFSP